MFRRRSRRSDSDDPVAVFLQLRQAYRATGDDRFLRAVPDFAPIAIFGSLGDPRRAEVLVEACVALRMVTRTVYNDITTPAPDVSRTALALHRAVRQIRARYRETPALWAAHIHVGP